MLGLRRDARRLLRRLGDPDIRPRGGQRLFEEFLARCAFDPICRVQGHHQPPTKKVGRLVRFNRSVRVLVHTAVDHGRWPKVEAMRIQWNRLLGGYVDTGETMVLMWRDLDWVTPQASNDPNGTWIKVKEVR